MTKDIDALTGVAADLADGKGFIYHCAEGQKDTIVVREFEHLAGFEPDPRRSGARLRSGVGHEKLDERLEGLPGNRP